MSMGRSALVSSAVGICCAAVAVLFGWGVGFLASFAVVMWMVEGGHVVVPQDLWWAVRVGAVAAQAVPVVLTVTCTVFLLRPPARQVALRVGLVLGSGALLYEALSMLRLLGR